ncbi:ATP-binding protein [Desulforamulus hydrothermalis]|uniref:Replicative DNA helicase loader DnaI n=1 Tax=Desulforamulus hydrothermalis Lam5 = DSM 18033 TaxID=1121428 RepID=K8E1C7_9FIRM|nr:ATP-binding protein [Desulforamulus hydrothermalis]CCO09480.1 Replicative DNA helicase loader DnaI [Desulforamulus hydrothermalis Lam5 = DSM 18033]SHH07325.1 replicative DNA helicase loader DnaI [Desulforamulus hydrothermalis Lam5 = DSM 18033]
MEFFDPESALVKLKNQIKSAVKVTQPIKKATCQLCNDRGIYLEGEYAVPCSCVKRKALEIKFKNCQIPRAMLNHSFNNFNFKYYSPTIKEPLSKRTYLEIAQRTYQYAQEFARDFVRGEAREGLLIQGPVGSGKTYLACCIANYVLRHSDQAVLFVVVPDLLEKIKASYSNTSQFTEYSLVEAACEVPLLIMDDLGAHSYTEWTRNKIYNIINYRLNHELPTVITTNLFLAGDLTELIGERTVSRIEQMCRPLWLERERDIREILREEKVGQSAATASYEPPY